MANYRNMYTVAIFVSFLSVTSSLATDTTQGLSPPLPTNIAQELPPSLPTDTAQGPSLTFPTDTTPEGLRGMPGTGAYCLQAIRDVPHCTKDLVKSIIMIKFRKPKLSPECCQAFLGIGDDCISTFFPIIGAFVPKLTGICKLIAPPPTEAPPIEDPPTEAPPPAEAPSPIEALPM